MMELLCRHRDAHVLPILLITDADENASSNYQIAGDLICDICTASAVHRIDETWRQRKELRQNVVGTVLWSGTQSWLSRAEMP